MNKTKTTQLSGLSDYELDLLQCVDTIKFTKSTLKCVKILEKFIDNVLKKELSETHIFTADDIKEAYELGRVHEEKNSDCTGDIVKKVYLESDKLHKSIKWE